jgi:hypothetical protein
VTNGLKSRDVSCAVILGRPLLLDWSRPLPTPPIDVEVPPNRRHVPLVARNPTKDPPTPLTRGIFLMEIAQILRDTQILEHDGPYPKDFRKVDQLHKKIEKVQEELPAFFRMENPDTRWDTPERQLWLNDARVYFDQMINFALLALHRPYIFHRKVSRDVALQVCLGTLHSHQSVFSDLPMVSYRK